MNILTHIDFESIKCPVGQLAIHPAHGLCEVVGSYGWRRTLRYRTTDPDGCNERLVEADVRLLREIRPLKHLDQDNGP